MNKKLLPMILAVGLIVNAFSMPAALANKDLEDKKEHAQEKMDEFMDAVDATDSQKEQIRAIHDKYKAQLMTLKEDLHQQKKDLKLYIFTSGATQTEALRRHEELMDKKQKIGELMLQAAFEKKALLTPEQQEEANEFMKEKFEEKREEIKED